MLKHMLKMLRDDRITIESIDIQFTGMFRVRLEVTYIDKATLIKKTTYLKYPDYSYACDAREKLESIAILY